MSLDETQTEWLKDFFQLLDENGKTALDKEAISKKSYDFAMDQKGRFDKYGDRMYLSAAQKSWLQDIKENL